MKRIGILSFVAIVGAWTVQASGGEKIKGSMDMDFLKKAVVGNYVEIQFGKLGSQRAASSQIQDYCKMLMTDHQKAQEKLGKMLKSRGVTITAYMDKDASDELAKLGKMQGADFDRAFIECMIQDHQKDIGVFENEAKNGQDEDVKAFAKECLPTLHKHLSKAQELSKTVSK